VEATTEAMSRETMSTTKIVLTTLATIVATGILIAGAFAVIGGFIVNAPQFTVVVFHAFQAPLFMPCVALGAGTTLVVGLVTYAISKCHRPKKPLKVVRREYLSS
jgi:K+ transporter